MSWVQNNIIKKKYYDYKKGEHNYLNVSKFISFKGLQVV